MEKENSVLANLEEKLKNENKKKEKAVIKLQKVCHHWLRGQCLKGDRCEYLHEMITECMPECHYYNGGAGTCSNKSCMYRHIDRHECLFYAKGYCKNGNMCKNKHTPREVCPDWMYGFCPKGPNCKLYHIPSPIAESDDNLDTLGTMLRTQYIYRQPVKPNWDHICHKCAQLGHTYKDCPFDQMNNK